VALQDKLKTRSQPLLPTNDPIRQVFVAQAGPHPLLLPLGAVAYGITYVLPLGTLGRLWISLIFAVFFLAFLVYSQVATKYRIVCVTDDAIHVLRSGMAGQPKELLATLPRQQRFGPASGLWQDITLNGENLRVHKRFHKDIEAADSATETSAS
jgi:hypothetical protein